jgi:hypothetical protein
MRRAWCGRLRPSSFAIELFCMVRQADRRSAAVVVRRSPRMTLKMSGIVRFVVILAHDESKSVLPDGLAPISSRPCWTHTLLSTPMQIGPS